jgi:hypothetical protein
MALSATQRGSWEVVMRKIIFVIVTIAFTSMPAIQVSAEIRREDLNRKIEVTEEQQLMNQVDIVSLYLTSEKAAWEPQLAYDNKIRVEINVLSQKLINNHDLLEDFVSRQISIFKRELSRRLHSSAPGVASHFDADNDLIFVVNEGAGRYKVAEVQNGRWHWTAKRSSSPAGTSSSRSAKDAAYYEETTSYKAVKKPNSCNCPALVGRK